MSYSSENQEEQRQRQQQEYVYNDYNYNDNLTTNASSSHEILGDPRIRVRRHGFENNAPRITLTPEEQIEVLTASPEARERLHQNMNRKCRYCNDPIPGEATEYFSPQDEHVRAGQCTEFNRLKQVREQSERAYEAISSSVDSIEFSLSKKREAEQMIESQILNLLSINAKHGLELPCASAQEWAQRYDNGKRDARTVCVTDSIGGGHRHKNEQLVVSECTFDKTGQIYYSPANITRKLDDFLTRMRQEHPSLMTQVDAKLSQANRRLTQEQ